MIGALPFTMMEPKLFSRRDFHAACLLSVPALALASCKTTEGGGSAHPGGPSFIAVDTHSKKIHAEGNSAAVRPIAELATIATALVTLDWAGANSGLGQTVQIEPDAFLVGGNTSLGFQAGDGVSVRDLMTAMVMNSDNVAATALAAHVGKSLGGGNPVAAFVDQMNQMALTVGAVKTRFTNPGGNESSGKPNLSTAADMARIGMRAALNPGFRFYGSQGQRTISVLRGGAPLPLTVTNSNDLLGVDSIDGLKLGGSARAGQCALITAERPSTTVTNSQGQQILYRHRMVVVVLGAPDRANMARELLQRGWETYFAWLQAGRPVAAATELLGQ